MRISDWSSDVCSSDLGRLWRAVKIQHTQPGKGGAYLQCELKDIRDGTKLNERFRASEDVERVRLDQKDYQYLYIEGDMLTFMDNERSEEHTSELQSLMRISYAVFCLKKKTTKKANI